MKTIHTGGDERMKRNMKEMAVKDIRIDPAFGSRRPRPEKLAAKREFYEKKGRFESPVYVDGTGLLVEGYTSYLIAVELGMETIRVCTDEPERKPLIKYAAEARHAKSAKLYAWEVPQRLSGKLQPGDEIIVATANGKSKVTVASVRPLAKDESLKPVLAKADPLFPVFKHIRENEIMLFGDLVEWCAVNRPEWARLIQADKRGRVKLAVEQRRKALAAKAEGGQA